MSVNSPWAASIQPPTFLLQHVLCLREEGLTRGYYPKCS